MLVGARLWAGRRSTEVKRNVVSHEGERYPSAAAVALRAALLLDGFVVYRQRRARLFRTPQPDRALFAEFG